MSVLSRKNNGKSLIIQVLIPLLSVMPRDLEQIIVFTGVFLISLIFSLMLIPLCKWIAFRFDIVDHPGERKVHVSVKPLLGGLAVFCPACLLPLSCILFFYILPTGWLDGSMAHTIELFQGVRYVKIQLFALVIGSTLIVLLGLIDDLYGVYFPARLKLVGQVIAASILVAAGIRTSFFSGVPLFDLVNIVISITWIVGITNSFNLLDNMDGLSSGVALIVTGILAFVTIHHGQFFVALLLSALGGALLGFYRYNVYPSTIFLGDAGSLFIGFILAAASILITFATPESSFVFPALMPVLIMSLPLFDTFSVIYVRLKQGAPIFLGDQNHLSHQLVRLGLTQPQAVQFIYLLTFCLGINATLLDNLDPIGALIVILQGIGIIGMVAIVIYLGAKKSEKEQDAQIRDVEFTDSEPFQ